MCVYIYMSAYSSDKTSAVRNMRSSSSSSSSRNDSKDIGTADDTALIPSATEYCTVCVDMSLLNYVYN